MEQEREVLESLINQAVDNASPLFTKEIVHQSQELDKHIVNFYKNN